MLVSQLPAFHMRLSTLLLGYSRLVFLLTGGTEFAKRPAARIQTGLIIIIVLSTLISSTLLTTPSAILS